jgi:alkyldihydroxyacetonephosphate synthase
MRRWNGWGDDSVTYHVPENALAWLREEVGEATPPCDVSLADLVRAVPAPELLDHPLVRVDPEDRIRHARGQSLPDWVAIRSGRVARFPDGVAYPESDDDLADLFAHASRCGAALIPYGGGTNVVGGINPEPGGPPVLTVDLSRMSHFLHLDEKSRLATFGAGIGGPNLEAALRTHGYTLGHFPQSFELSTLGGWIAARSSGQQSLHYGRIEHLFAGGRLVTPTDTLAMNPYPASAAGPDLRQLVLGSEGRLGIVSRATVRISPLPEREEFHGIFFPGWGAGVEAARVMAQARLTLSMLRLSNPAETEANLTLAGHEDLVGFAHTGLDLIGYRRGEKCMLLLGATGDAASVRCARRHAIQIARKHGGLHTGQYMGKTWARSRFTTPYLRNTLWEQGYAIDTLETIVPWSDVLPTAGAIIHAIEEALTGTGEKVFVFAHLSHVYPTGSSIYVTFIFRVLPDPDRQLEYWGRMKHAASQAIVAHGGTISHQHGVGVDHASYLEAEKGELGIKLITDVMRCCDPDGILNPGKLVRAAALEEV